MNMPHVCRCGTCGAQGVITPSPLMWEYFPEAFALPEAFKASLEALALCKCGYTVCAVCKFPQAPALQD